jgi:tetratricopeptide (TPR) repeat protein
VAAAELTTRQEGEGKFMPRRISTTSGFLKYALNLARNDKYNKALSIIQKVEKRALTSDDLQKIALAHSYGGQLAASEASWLEVERRNEMKSGGYLMLASLQMELAKPVPAIESLEKEIHLAKTTSNKYYLSSAAIRLGYLQIKAKDYSKAKDTLALIGDEEGDFIPNLGYKTKAALLKEVSG